ncbi:MAG: TRAP transporter small permease subunit [Saprospiraceae bacterium]|nr:TRAP transporter small permease subunit [Saprospiraceae bacterium]
MYWIDKFIEKIGIAVSWLNVLLIALICLDVIFRYFFSFSKNWIIELEWHMFAVIFLLGSAYALQVEKHVRVDVFYQRFSKKTQTIINLLGTIVFLIPWCYLVIRTSSNFVSNSWYIREGSPQPGGLPARYVIKAMIVIGFVLLLIQGISLILKYLKELQSGKWSS